MMTFAITTETGTAEVSALSFADIPSRLTADAIKVERIDRKQLKRDERHANIELAKLGREYLEGDELDTRVNAILDRHGFSTLDKNVTEIREMRSVPVGRGIYLTVTTYRMPSGRFEFVGYLS